MVRLFVIPAKFEPVAVILSRGPTDWYHVIQWEMRRHLFTHGAWIKGRIYEEKCGLSLDGKLFLYSVLQASRGGSELTHAWTAISRPPWLSAIVLWPQGTTHGGGGRFVDNRSVALRVSNPPHRNFPLGNLRVVQGEAPEHVSSNDVPDADWCGRDHRDRVIFTRGGQLFRRGKKSDELLADFTDLTPRPEPAPAWASRPL